MEAAEAGEVCGQWVYRPLWQEGSTEQRDEKVYWGDSGTSPFPFWEFRLGSTGLEDSGKSDEQKRDRVTIVL